MKAVCVALSLALAVALCVAPTAQQRVGVIGKGVPKGTVVSVGGGADDISTDNLSYTCTFSLGSGDPFNPTLQLAYVGKGAAGTTSGIAVKNIDGTDHLFILGKPYSVGGVDTLLEFSDPGCDGARAPLIADYGDPLSATRFTDYAPDQVDSGGIHYVASEDVFWIGHGASYTQTDNPAYTKTRIDTTAHTITSIEGPYGTNSHSQSTRTYMTDLPASVTAILGAQYKTAVGAGPTPSLSPYGWGVFLEAFKSIPDGTTVDGFGAANLRKVGGSVLIGHGNCVSIGGGSFDCTHRQTRPDTVDRVGWTYYGGASGYPDRSGHQPQQNPVQDGSGCNDIGDKCGVYVGTEDGDFQVGRWTDIDAVGGCELIDGAVKSGIVCIGQLADSVDLANRSQTYPVSGRPHYWYAGGQDECGGCGDVIYFLDPFGYRDFSYGQTTGPHTIDMKSTLWIYSISTMRSVALGSLSAFSTTPIVDAFDMSHLAHTSASAWPQRTNDYSAYHTAYSPTTHRLYVMNVNSEQVGSLQYQPVVRVISVIGVD